MDTPLHVLQLRVENGAENAATTSLDTQHDDLTVLTASTAQEGIDLADSEPVDCIVAPFDLPEMDRTDFLGTLRERESRLPVVFHAPDPEPGDTILNDDFTDVVSNPDDESQESILRARVRNYARYRQTNRRLWSQNEQFLTLFENFPEPTIAYDCADERLLFRSVNNAFEETFGIEEQTVLGQPVADVLVPADGTDDPSEITDEILAQNPIGREVRRETSSGDRIFRVQNIPADGTAPLDGVAMYVDITERKQREKKLRERETELEQQKENLQQQTAQLEYQNERLDEFASIVSHDLRNPLNVAKGRLDILQAQLSEVDSESVEGDNASKIEESLDRMEAIIDDALMLARQGKAITEMDPVDLGGLVENAWSNVDTAQARIEYCDSVEIDADSDRLLNVFENFFRNTVEHGSTGNQTESADRVEHGGTDLTVRVGLLDDGFYVEDDGPGIDDSQKDDVFNRGYTTSRAGTGFGLAIVEDIVRAHGWEVTVTDSDDGGARFEIRDVEFSWEQADLVDVLSETLGYQKATRLVEDAMDRAGVERAQFDRETAVTIFDTITVRDDVSSLAEVAAMTAKTQIES
jgi:PAS domain S-box-containing protein